MLALAGGFVTPLLVNSGTNAEVQLFSYLALLNAGLLWVSYVRTWRSLPLAFLFSVLYFWSWYSTYYDAGQGFAAQVLFHGRTGPLEDFAQGNAFVLHFGAVLVRDRCGHTRHLREIFGLQHQLRGKVAGDREGGRSC